MRRWAKGGEGEIPEAPFLFGRVDVAYKDKEKQAEAMRRYRLKKKGITEGDNGITQKDNAVNPEGRDNVNPETVTVYRCVTLSRPVDLGKAPDPDDALDPRNYSEAYLEAMAKQGATLTEASRPARLDRRVPLLITAVRKTEAPLPLNITLAVKGKTYRLDDKDVPPIVKALADTGERERMRKIVASLDREIHGLGGKKENMLDLVRRGCGQSSVTMREVKNLLTAF